MYVMVYHLDLNNIDNVARTDLNIINRFLAHYISISLNIKSIKISKQFYNFKLRLYGFVSSTFF